MTDKGRSGAENALEMEDIYFRLQASWGITKHLGGAGATIELADACKVDSDTNLLYVGSGVGISPCYLVKKYGCRLTGIDISEEMVSRSRERAKKEGITVHLQCPGKSNACLLPSAIHILHGIKCMRHTVRLTRCPEAYTEGSACGR